MSLNVLERTNLCRKARSQDYDLSLGQAVLVVLGQMCRWFHKPLGDIAASTASQYPVRLVARGLVATSSSPFNECPLDSFMQPENAIARLVKKEVKKKVRKLRGCSDSDTDDDEFEDDLVSDGRRASTFFSLLFPIEWELERFERKARKRFRGPWNPRNRNGREKRNEFSRNNVRVISGGRFQWLILFIRMTEETVLKGWLNATDETRGKFKRSKPCPTTSFKMNSNTETTEQFNWLFQNPL